MVNRASTLMLGRSHWMVLQFHLKLSHCTVIIHLEKTRKYPLRGYILGVLTHTTALDRLGEVMELWPCGFKIEYTHLGFASAGAVWLGIWNSDHVVLKSSIRSSASPRSAAVLLGFWNSDHLILKLSIRSSASPRSVAVWFGLWTSKRNEIWKYQSALHGPSGLTGLPELWSCAFKIEYTYHGFTSAGAVWLGIWNSDHVVLKLSIRTSASPRQEQSDLASGTLTMWFQNRVPYFL